MSTTASRRHSKLLNVGVSNTLKTTSSIYSTAITTIQPNLISGDWEWLAGEQSWVFVNQAISAVATNDDPNQVSAFGMKSGESSSAATAVANAKLHPVPTEKSCYSHSPPDMTLAVSLALSKIVLAHNILFLRSNSFYVIYLSSFCKIFFTKNLYFSRKLIYAPNFQFL